MSLIQNPSLPRAYTANTEAPRLYCPGAVELGSVDRASVCGSCQPGGGFH